MAARRCVTGDILVEVMKVPMLFGTGPDRCQRAAFIDLEFEPEHRCRPGIRVELEILEL
jgi:hypothetical protein